ncbi:MAG: hypothetical protein PHE03_01960 [Bacteroidales bacterium]|nr:hypothetical protein [Bacteroidales bacterium]MDD3891049.1 hypothetical protein [Bacteroidales bacterium]
MKKVSPILVAIMVIALSSCITHYFADPVPIDVKDSSSIPEPMLGTWTAKDKTHTIDLNKWISEKVDSLGNKNIEVEFTLSDSLIIKRSDDYFFFNNLENNGYWTVYLGYKRNSSFIIKGLGSADTLTLANSIGFVPDSVNDAKERYFNTPFTNELMKKFIKDGGFADTLIVFDIVNRTLKDLD